MVASFAFHRPSSSRMHRVPIGQEPTLSCLTHHQDRGMALRIDFTSQEYLRDPAAGIARLRASGPVVKVSLPIVGRIWVTTTLELADQVLKDSETFTLRRDGGKVVGLRWWMPGIFRTLASSMLTVDEPDHTRLRGLVDEAFRRRAILDMEPRIHAIAGELASELFADGSPADLVARYARKLPLSVICELLGLPLADRPKFMAWAGNVTGVSSPIGFLRMIPGITAIRRYLERHLETARMTGGEGLIAELVQVEKEGEKIGRDEMVAMMFLILFAGHETTTHLISGAVFELLKDPPLRDWLAEDWRRADLAVEEILRLLSPVEFFKPRVVRKALDLGGVR